MKVFLNYKSILNSLNMSMLFMCCYMRTKKKQNQKICISKKYIFFVMKKDVKNYKNDNEAAAAYY